MFWHSDGTHSLQRIHWWISEVLLNFSKETNLSTFWMVSKFFSNFHFWVNYSFEEILFIKKRKLNGIYNICKLYHLWGNSEHAAGTMNIKLWNREKHVVISSTEPRSHIFGISILAIFVRNVITYNTPTIMTCSGPWRNVIFCNRLEETNANMFNIKSYTYSNLYRLRNPNII